jgi:hypothetical protein
LRRDDIVAKARSAIGHGTLYRLGAGAPHTAPYPWDETGSCDCSGFVCWVLGLSRYQPHFDFLKTINGGWLNTDGMYHDSTVPAGYFIPETAPRPGSLIVYPSRSYAKHNRLGTGPRIGHVGILGPIDNAGIRTVIHCSSGNYKRRSDAIAQTNIDVFTAVPYTRYIRFAEIET